MSENKRLTLDIFLEEQSQSKFVATIEGGDESQPDVVKVTPWISGKGCLCKSTIKVSKSAIEAVTPTGQTHRCCNKTLKVVEVHFKEGESISLNDLFDQLYESAAGDHSHEEEAPARQDFSAGPQFFPGPRQFYEPRRRYFTSPLSWFPPYDWWKTYQAEKCQNALRNCQANCAFDDYPVTCDCNCKNSFKLCTGEGEPEVCPNSARGF